MPLRLFVTAGLPNPAYVRPTVFLERITKVDATFVWLVVQDLVTESTRHSLGNHLSSPLGLQSFYSTRKPPVSCPNGSKFLQSFELFHFWKRR